MADVPSSEVAALSRLVAQLRSRLTALERSSQLGRSSVQGSDGQTYSVRAGIIAGVEGSSMAASALSALTDMQATADGTVTVFYREDAPTEEADNPEYGDQWLVTGAGTTYGGAAVVPGSLLTYDGDTWVVRQNAGDAADALSAAQNAQDTADGKIVTFWQAADPRPAHQPSSGDLWYQLDASQQVLAVWRWDEGGQAWRNLPLTTGAIAPAGIAPDRLSVGVVANLVQDPALQTAIHVPSPPDWTITGPDAAYPANNYLRCQDRTQGTEGTPSADSTYMLTDRVPVDSGRTIRAAALVRCDVAAVSGTAPTEARLRAYFYRTGDPTPLSGDDQTAGVTLADVMGGAYGQWLPMEGTFLVPEGYTSVQVAAQVTNQTDGAVDYIRPEVQVLWGNVQSADYVEGAAGWALSSDATQFANVYVVGGLGAEMVSASTLALAGVDVGTWLRGLPGGVIASGRSYGPNNTAETSSTVRMVTHELHGGAMAAGRMYRVRAHGYMEPSSPGATFEIAVIYTTDGTTPAVGSPILDGSVRTVVTSPDSDQASFDTIATYTPQTSYANTRFSFTIRRLAGSGTAHVKLDDINKLFEMWIEDWGVNDAVPAAGNNGELVLRSGPSAATADPVQTYTRSWPTTWSRSYNGDKTGRGGGYPTAMYQGYTSGVHDNQRSLCGFDYGDIQVQLAGATIKSVTLTYRLQHAHDTDGIAVYVSSHNYTSQPSTWGSAVVNEDRAHFGGQQEGGTYIQPLPVAVGNEFKSGSTRGLGFGPAPSNSSAAYYGYMFGFGTDTPPVLTIVYTK